MEEEERERSPSFAFPPSLARRCSAESRRKAREREREKPAIRENGICSCSFLPPSPFPPFLVRPPPRPFRQQGGRAGPTLYPFRLGSSSSSSSAAAAAVAALRLASQRGSSAILQGGGGGGSGGAGGGRGFANFLGTRNEKGGPSPPTSTALAKLGPSSSLSSSSSFPSQLANLFCAQIRNNAEPSPSPPLLPQSFVCLPPPPLPPLLCNFFPPACPTGLHPVPSRSCTASTGDDTITWKSEGESPHQHHVAHVLVRLILSPRSTLPRLGLLRPQSRVARGLDCDLVKKRSVPELEKERAEDPPHQRTKILKSEDNISNSPPPLLLPLKVTSLLPFWPSAKLVLTTLIQTLLSYLFILARYFSKPPSHPIHSY